MVEFQISHGFIQGSTHLVCEDYAMSSTIAGMDLTVVSNPLIIVSDGCSSVDDTDVGARIVALSARRVFNSLIVNLKTPDAEAVAGDIIAQISAVAETIGLPLSSCAATLLVGFVMRGTCHVYVFGDGVWYRRSRSGELSYTVIEAPDQKPPYLVNGPREAVSLSEGPDECEIALIDYPSDERGSTKKKWFHWSFSAGDVSEFGIATDGICAVKQRETTAVLESLTGDRTEYLINNFLDTHPYLYDDIGLATIHLSHLIVD